MTTGTIAPSATAELQQLFAEAQHQQEKIEKIKEEVAQECDNIHNPIPLFQQLSH